jgi:3-chloro-4-hydroxyphenylacetate reductive dehalogenase
MTRIFTSDYRENRKKPEYLDPFPVHKLKRVDRPTTIINESEIKRPDERTSGFFRAGNGEFGEHMRKEYKRFVPKHPLSGALVSISGTLANIVDAPQKSDQEDITTENIAAHSSSYAPMDPMSAEKAPQTDDPDLMARNIKETAYFLRSDMVGICELPRYAVYSHRKPDGKKVTLNHKYAIAILIDQDWFTASASTGSDWISNSMSFISYSTSGFIACVLADYIRKLGYPARAHHAMNYQVAIPPILLWAGLGEVSRMGEVVLNPFLGPRFKAAIVTTDLPMTIDKPIDFGLQDFCSKCKKCADKCPSSAISSGDKEMFNGYEKWPTNVDRCTKMRIGNQLGASCGTCIKVCPWNKPYTPFHRTISWGMMKFPFLRRFGVWGDDLLGYGKPDYTRKWWLDLEKVDGKFIIPNSNKKALKD